MRKIAKSVTVGSQSSASKIRTIPEDTENSGPPSAMRRLVNRKIREQKGKCGICGEPFTEYNDIVPDHIEPKVWELREETIILTTFRQLIGSATWKKDQRE